MTTRFTALFITLFFLFFSYNYSFTQCLPTTVTTLNGQLTDTTCPSDGEPDIVRFKPNTWATGYVWILTDSNDIIMDFFWGNKYDFEPLGEGVCHVWGLSYTGILNVPAGQYIFDVDFGSWCWIISTNFVEITRVIPEGGMVETSSGQTIHYSCPGDGNADVIDFLNNNSSGDNYAYLITDENDNIVALPTGDSYDFEGLPNGTCKVYGLSYSGTVSAEIGANVFDSDLSDNCFDLSDNFIEIIKDIPEGGTVNLDDGMSFRHICVNDGNPNVISFENAGVSNSLYAYLITTDDGVILSVEMNDFHDFEDAPPGNCRVYGMAYTGNIMILDGQNIGMEPLTDDCYDLSDNYIEIKRSVREGGEIELSSGGTAAFVCGGDGNADVLTFMTTSTSTANYDYLITDESGIIYGIGFGDIFEFDDIPTGIARVYGMSYVDQIIINQGDDIFSANLASDCWELSSNFIEIIVDMPEGGMISDSQGATTLYTCPGDGNADIIGFSHAGVSNSDYTYILTDENGIIINQINGNSYDFDDSPLAICQVWGLAFTGNTSIEAGESIFAATLSDDCFDLSDNALDIIKETPIGGSVRTADGELVHYTCPGDGNSDVVNFEATGQSNSQYAYVITDDQNIVMGITTNDFFDFENAGSGLCLVWGVAYTGNITLEIGDDRNLLPFSDDCQNYSSDWVIIIREVPNGGTVADQDGNTDFTLCTGDGNADVIELEASDISNSLYNFVITDENDQILEFTTDNVIDFENTGGGNVKVYGVSFTGNFNGNIGEDINSVPLSDDCFDLSDNFISITKIGVDAGEIATAQDETTVYICPGDGNPNVLNFTTTSTASNAEYRFVITNNLDVILELPTQDFFDFENAGIGICKVWGVSYTGDFTAQVGENLNDISLSNECFAVTSTPIEVIRDQPNGDLVATSNGFNVEFCVGDGIPDDNVIFLSGSFSFAQYMYIVTDENDEILDFFSNITYDFDNYSGGICKVWGLSFTGNFIGNVGDLVGDVVLSDDCYSLSTNFVTVTKKEVDGATVFSPSGNEIFTCPGDGVPDFVGMFHASSVGADYNFLITDADGNLIEAEEFTLYNFEGLGEGTCQIWGVSFTGDLIIQEGENIHEVVLSSDCYELSSNMITVHRAIPNGGTVSTIDGDTEITISLSDNPEDIYFINQNASNSKYKYIVTDEDNVILAILEDDFSNFENSEPGACRVWGLAYTGGILAEPGQNLDEVDLASGCYDLSDNFVLINKEEGNRPAGLRTIDSEDESIILNNKPQSFESLILMPNPVESLLSISFKEEAFIGHINLKVSSIDGVVHFKTQKEAFKGENIYELNVSDLPAGIYLLSINNEAYFMNQKFIKF